MVRIEIRFAIVSLLVCMLKVRGTESHIDLLALEKKLDKSLELINYPPDPWRPSVIDSSILDVAIIGGGMSGCTAAFALLRQGVTNIQVYDQNAEGFEGPWMTFARMRCLQSWKGLMGPALSIPYLTFQAWYQALMGEQAWQELDFIPNEVWMNYLKWYRKVLNLPVKNKYKLELIVPHTNYFELRFINSQGFAEVIKTRKIVLATGRSGFGGLSIPTCMNTLSKEKYAHAGEVITESLKDKHIVVIGNGASAFDAAAYALEKKAQSVTMLMRGAKLSNISKTNKLSFEGCYQGFYYLADKDRYRFFDYLFSEGKCPPPSALKRVEGYQNFALYRDILIIEILENSESIEIKTSHKSFHCDYIIVATGFEIDGFKQQELAQVIDKILLWGDRIVAKDRASDIKKRLGRFPYLGQSFEFLEKKQGIAPFLKNIYCFNYAASLSHGLISMDIKGISVGATRLAQGIAADLFVQEAPAHFKNLQDYSQALFDEQDFSFLLS
ncbi:MAG TPA: NAD(P)/FAD-dependent oxidoreductase [Candidatus Babeliaceae bacterium]|nr:NAD(P)/FAD-dependent oxidoreductase [Candidatus Babeliaceae bacterium]